MPRHWQRRQRRRGSEDTGQQSAQRNQTKEEGRGREGKLLDSEVLVPSCLQPEPDIFFVLKWRLDHRPTRFITAASLNGSEEGRGVGADTDRREVAPRGEARTHGGELGLRGGDGELPGGRGRGAVGEQARQWVVGRHKGASPHRENSDLLEQAQGGLPARYQPARLGDRPR